MLRFARYALLLVAALLLAQPAPCANLVSGGSFDSPGDLSFWQNVGFSKTVSGTQDHTGGGSSSLRIDNTSGVSGQFIYQCIPITENEPYSLEAYTLQPASEQTATGRAEVDLYWYGAADCTQSLGFAAVNSSGSTNDQWEFLASNGVVPSGVSSVELYLSGWNTVDQSTKSHVVYFDDVYLPEPDANILAIATLVSLYTVFRFRRAA